MAAIAVSSLLFSACDDTPSSSNCQGTGAERCIGAMPPDLITDEADGSVTFEWTQPNGPRCVRGSEFRSFLKPGPDDASTLVFYLPNDGAWLPNSSYALLAGGKAPANLASAKPTPLQAQSDELFGPHHFTYISPCDGSLYVGDRDYSSDELTAMDQRDTAPRFYRGFLNVAASMNATAARYPSPQRVIVVGSGAGSFGVALAGIQAAEQFPNADIFVFQDGSPGISMGDIDLTFTQDLIDAWGARQSLPSFCTDDCLKYGHLQEFLVQATKHYPQFRAATLVASREPAVPAFINLTPGIKQKILPETFECLISKELERARSAAGQRYDYYVVAGAYNRLESIPGQLTFAATTPDGEAPAIGDWIRSFLSKQAGFGSHSEIPMGVTTDCASL